MKESEVIALVVKTHYLLSRGWEYNEYSEEWTKPGRIREVRTGSRYCCDRHSTEKVAEFDTESAYEAEQDYESKTVSVVMEM